MRGSTRTRILLIHSAVGMQEAEDSAFGRPIGLANSSRVLWLVGPPGVRRGFNYRSTVVGRLKCSDIEFVHGHHRVDGLLGTLSIG